VTRAHGGTGLGLTICRRLIELMGGAIGVDARPEGGSVFWFTLTLPLSHPQQRWAGEVEASLAGCRVLIVDDNEINRMIFERQLLSLGAEVTTAMSAQSALSRIEVALECGQPFELAILDHMMPGTDGIDLCAMIRDRGWDAGMTLVLSSSSGVVNTDGKARQSGFDHALPKPLRPGALREALCWWGEGTELQQVPVTQTAEVTTIGAAQQTAPVEASSTSTRVLVAEDNATNQLIISTVLKKRGYRVELVANGQEALRALRDLPFDIVLMDVQMPVMDGIEATGRVREFAGSVANIPIIGVTAHALKGDRERFIAAGMNDYIEKPIRSDDMFAKIEQWVAEAEKPSARATNAVREFATSSTRPANPYCMSSAVVMLSHRTMLRGAGAAKRPHGPLAGYPSSRSNIVLPNCARASSYIGATAARNAERSSSESSVISQFSATSACCEISSSATASPRW